MSKRDSKKGKGAADMISKFQGDGLTFKAKFYGTAVVKEARGDAMCQQAIHLMKTAVKTASQHKQKIIIKVNMSGVTLVDSVTNQVLHQHQVNKISFISKDAADNRSFSYVVGGDGDGKHVLFGVKTDKPCDVVVLSLRDLFQAVYQLSQQKRSSRTSSTVSVDSASRASVSSNSASISANKGAGTPISELPLNTTQPSSPTSTESQASLHSDTKIENPPDVIPVVALTDEIIPEVQEPKVLNFESESVPLGSVDVPRSTADELPDLEIGAESSASDPRESSILRQIERELSFTLDTNAVEGLGSKKIDDVTKTEAFEQISSPSSSIRSNVSSKPAGPDSVSITSSEPQLASAAPVMMSTADGTPSAINVDNPWDKDIDFGADPFFFPPDISKTGTVAVDNSSPWGGNTSGAVSSQPANSDSWAAFGSSDDWATSDKTDNSVKEDNPWGSSDPWAESSPAGNKLDALGMSGPFDVDFSRGVTDCKAPSNDGEPTQTVISKSIETEQINESNEPNTIEDKSNGMLKDLSAEQDKVFRASDVGAGDVAVTGVSMTNTGTISTEDSVLTNGPAAVSSDQFGEKKTNDDRRLDADDPFGCVTPDPDHPFNAEPDPFTVTSNILTAEKPLVPTQNKDEDPFNLTISMKPKPSVEPFSAAKDAKDDLPEDCLPNAEEDSGLFRQQVGTEWNTTPGSADPTDDPFGSLSVYSVNTPKSEARVADQSESLFANEKSEVVDGSKSSDPFADSDPFSNSDPFADDPFGSDPFSNQNDPFSSKEDPFSKHSQFGNDDPFGGDKVESFPSSDPFADVDPFAFSISSVKSLKVDSDPFGNSWGSFPSNKAEVTNDLSSQLLQPSTASGIALITPEQPKASFDVSMKPEKIIGAIGGASLESDNKVKAVENNELTDSDNDTDDDQLSSGPPSCPPPSLPPGMVVSVNNETTPLPAAAASQPPVRKPPPAIPARRPTSNLISPPAALPPVPSRSCIGRVQSQLESQTSTSIDLTMVTSNGTTQPPDIPPPSLPPPKSTPPTLPSRSISAEPPKLPERPKSSKSLVEENPSVIGNNPANLVDTTKP